MAGCIWLLLLLLGLHGAEPSVFLSASKASDVLVRWKRAGSYLLEEIFEGNLEKECYEEICVYEEAREVFEVDETTDEFWQHYMGGSPCVSQPCLNNGTCQDNIRSYTCTCSSGYEGKDCAFAKNECHPLRTDGCQHFCHPGQDSYICSCAQGYKLGQDYKSCIPHGKTNRFEGNDFCGGVIIEENFVLTTAKCSLLHRNISVKTNFPRMSKDPLTIEVKRTHVHMMYEEETGDNDISLLELELPIQCPDMGLPICMPEQDFAERILIPGTQGLLIGWTSNGSELGNAPMQVPVTHMDSEECGRALNVTVTTRTYCERERQLEGCSGRKGAWLPENTKAPGS